MVVVVVVGAVVVVEDVVVGAVVVVEDVVVGAVVVVEDVVVGAVVVVVGYGFSVVEVVGGGVSQPVTQNTLNLVSAPCEPSLLRVTLTCQPCWGSWS